MTTEELIEALDQRYGNPYAAKECGLIQEAIQHLKNYDMMFTATGMEKLNEGSTGHRDEQSAQ
jgi:hypothetical protein